jgi:hypothetical protein
MALLEPWISLTTQAAPPATSGFWTFLGNLLGIGIVQGVTLAIFYNKLSDDRRKEQQDRATMWEQFEKSRRAENERDLKNLQMNMKREVFLDIAPIIQENANMLAEYLRVDEPLQDIQKSINERLKIIQKTLGKAVPVASLETLDAIRALQSSLLVSRMRMVQARATFDQVQMDKARREAAARVLFDAWEHESSPLPAIVAELAACVRKDLEMPFNKEQFEDGIQKTNQRNIVLMRREIFGEDARR